MDARQQRGLEIAATANLAKRGGVWLVPSQSGHGRYTVWPDLKIPRCTCPDHEEGGFKCKHIFAVEYAITRERNDDGSTTVTERLTIQKTVQRTYSQNWSAYNEAQTHEKERFLDLLHDLCSGVSEPVAEEERTPAPAASGCALCGLLQDLQHGVCPPLHERSSRRRTRKASFPRFLISTRSSTTSKIPH